MEAAQPARIEELSALLPKEQLYRLYEQATREPYSFLFVYYLKPKCSTSALKSVLHLKKTPMGAFSFLGQKLFASSTLINAKCENISYCTSVAVQPPVVRRTGGFLKKRMTTIYKRVAGSDSDFKVDLEESLCGALRSGWSSSGSFRSRYPPQLRLPPVPRPGARPACSAAGVPGGVRPPSAGLRRSGPLPLLRLPALPKPGVEGPRLLQFSVALQQWLVAGFNRHHAFIPVRLRLWSAGHRRTASPACAGRCCCLVS